MRTDTGWRAQVDADIAAVLARAPKHVQKLLALRGDVATATAAVPAPAGYELTWHDFYCGGGGSTSGIHRAPGNRVILAVNHWDVAIATHNTNHPSTDHDRADIRGLDPRRYPSADCAWFSPECTTWSVARGKKRDYDARTVQMMFDEDVDERPLPDEATQRSRAQMEDVVRFSRHHQYKAVIVENVTDILTWEFFDRWISDMRAEGYHHEVIILNSAFAGALGTPAPQLRDRIYIAFWKAKYRRPTWAKWLRPRAYCPTCETDVNAIQTIKDPHRRRRMTYGASYFYRCPSTTCRGAAVQPYARPAATAINFSIPGKRIGDRKRPLAPATRERIAAGLRRHAGRRFLAPLRSGRPRTLDPATQQLATIVADGGNHAVVEPLLVPCGGSWRAHPTSVNDPMPARTTSESDALLVPLRNNGVARPADTHPLATFAANGTHHALVMRNNTPRGDAGQMCTPVDEPLRTLTTAGHQSLLQWSADHRIYTYDAGDLRDPMRPLPTQTAVEGDALMRLAADVDDCLIRMVQVDEIRDGMNFDRGYILLGRTGGENVRMLGNAVTPCSSAVLAAAVAEAITGADYQLAA